MKFLQLKLQAPLQSWGERSRWDSRDTSALPTKSGVIGMLGCCMGLKRGDPKLEKMDNGLHMAVRVDKPGMPMTDFHTVQTESGGFPIAAGGKKPGNTILTPKQYLQDAEYTVWLWGEENLLEECRKVLLHPSWTAYLGRRNCVPAVPLLPKMLEADSVEEAVRAGAAADTAVEIECLPEDKLRGDERLSQRADGLANAAIREFRYRTVRSSVIRKEG